jgi:F-type H+-transporting ATPase subunit delta
MSHTLIAQRYAKAIFDLALEMNLVEQVRNDMEIILSVCDANKDFSLMLRSPVIRSDKKIRVVEAVFGKELGELSMRYISIIIRKRREEYLRYIAAEFINIYKEFMSIFTVYFKSATEISDDIRKKVVELLEKQTGGSIELIEEVRKDLVGGFVLSYDDYKYDASIAYQLRKLKKSAAEINLYVRGL